MIIGRKRCYLEWLKPEYWRPRKMACLMLMSCEWQDMRLSHWAQSGWTWSSTGIFPKQFEDMHFHGLHRKLMFQVDPSRGEFLGWDYVLHLVECLRPGLSVDVCVSIISEYVIVSWHNSIRVTGILALQLSGRVEWKQENQRYTKYRLRQCSCNKIPPNGVCPYLYNPSVTSVTASPSYPSQRSMYWMPYLFRDNTQQMLPPSSVVIEPFQSRYLLILCDLYQTKVHTLPINPLLTNGLWNVQVEHLYRIWIEFVLRLM